MSADPATMQALLTRQLMQQPQTQGAAPGQLQTATSPMGAASQLAQKVMLMRALQQQPHGQPPTQLPPQPNMLGGVNALPQQMNQQPVPGGING